MDIKLVVAQTFVQIMQSFHSLCSGQPQPGRGNGQASSAGVEIPTNYTLRYSLHNVVADGYLGCELDVAEGQDERFFIGNELARDGPTRQRTGFFFVFRVFFVLVVLFFFVVYARPVFAEQGPARPTRLRRGVFARLSVAIERIGVMEVGGSVYQRASLVCLQRGHRLRNEARMMSMALGQAGDEFTARRRESLPPSRTCRLAGQYT